MQKIITCLGFDYQAEEAINFYTSVIPNSKILSTTRYGDTGPGPKGSLLAASFLLNGHEFMALNGGPPFKFSIRISTRLAGRLNRLGEFFHQFAVCVRRFARNRKALYLVEIPA